MFKSYDEYVIKIYSPQKALQLLKEKKIVVRNFKKISDYTYKFKVEPKYKKQVLKCFSEAILIKRYGPKSIVHNLISKKTTVISLIITLILFIFASTRIYRVDISGGNEEIDNQIRQKLTESNIEKYQSLPSNIKLKNLQTKLEKELISNIEFLEIRRTGLVIEVKYEKRREPIVLHELKRNLIASKDGVIKKIMVEHGQKMIQVNDYVKKGDLLISAYINVNDTKQIELFTKAKVYAYTWKIIEYKCDTGIREESEILSYFLSECDRKALEDTNEGTIDERNILSFKYGINSSYIKLHYQLIENIAIEQ